MSSLPPCSTTYHICELSTLSLMPFSPSSKPSPLVLHQFSPTLPVPRGSPQPPLALHASSVPTASLPPWFSQTQPSALCSAFASLLDHQESKLLRINRFIATPPAHTSYYSEFKPRPSPMPLPQGPLGIRYYGCNAGRRSTMRHDPLLRLIMVLVQQEWNCDSAMEPKALASGSSDPTAAKPYSKVDLIIWCPDMRPCVIAIDATIVSPTLPSHIAETLKGNLFNDAAEIKNANHLQGCNERERGFLPIVFSIHGGVGPDIARQWLHSIFAASFVRERMMGRSGVDTARSRELLMQSLHAVSTKGTDMSYDSAQRSYEPPALSR